MSCLYKYKAVAIAAVDAGEPVMRAGACVLRPPGIRHCDGRHLDDPGCVAFTGPAQVVTCPECARR